MNQPAPGEEHGTPFSLYAGHYVEYGLLLRQTPPARVGICAIVRDEASYIEEWVAFHRCQGVSLFRIYDNGSTDGTAELLRRLGIEPVLWGGMDENFDSQQRAAYMEGAQMLAGQVDWLAFIDVDEFMFCRSWSLAEALSVILGNVGAIAVQQDVFGSGGQTARLPGPVTTRFTRRAALTHPECRWFKTIARPELVAGFDSVHSVTLKSGAYLMADASPLTRTGPHPGEAARRVEGVIRMHHYMLKSLEEFCAKQAKWATRNLRARMSDDYFFERDRYANAEECRDLASG